MERGGEEESENKHRIKKGISDNKSSAAATRRMDPAPPPADRRVAVATDTKSSDRTEERLTASRLQQQEEQHQQRIPEALESAPSSSIDQRKLPPSASASASQATHRKKGSNSSKKSPLSDMKLPFPLKLHYLLDDAETQGFDNIISWTKDGDSFQIYEPELFMNEICSQYFRQTRFYSFIRVSKYLFLLDSY